MEILRVAAPVTPRETGRPSPPVTAQVDAAPREIVGIQYLRAAAALAVLVFHMGMFFDVSIELGKAGVDLFFVISGFIMMVTTATRPTTPWTFIERRFWRVAPLYWVVTLATLAGLYLRPWLVYQPDLSLRNILGSFIFLPVLDEMLAPVVIQGWTLTFELIFYLALAGTLAISTSPARRLMLLATVFGVAVEVSPVLPIAYARELTQPLILEFVAGAAVGLWWVRGQKVGFGIAVTLTVFALVLLLALDQLAPALDRAWRAGLPCMLLVTGVVGIERAGRMPYWGIPNMFGDASYSIYLWHNLAIGILGITLQHLSVPLPIQLIVMPIGTVAACIVAWRVLERPLIALVRKQRTLRTPRPV